MSSELPQGFYIRRGAYIGGGTMLLWRERWNRCDVVLESADWFLSHFAREQRIKNPAEAFLFLAYVTRQFR